MFVQDLLTNGSLADVTACHSKLSSFSAALQEEVAARQAAVAALNAELARQVRTIGRVRSCYFQLMLSASNMAQWLGQTELCRQTCRG